MNLGCMVLAKDLIVSNDNLTVDYLSGMKFYADLSVYALDSSVST